MTFRRGTTLPVEASLGHADTSSIGPTAGNGFYKRWPDDLALLAESGVTDLRLTFDWARLQQRPGEYAGDWAERYENILDAAAAIGIVTWACLLDGGVPRWFDNEGGLDDAAAVETWWPRWVERVADRVGDRVAGWIPLATPIEGFPQRAWLDTWGILRGDAPVVFPTRADHLAHAATLSESFDRIGVVIDSSIDPDVVPDDDDIRIAGERWDESVTAAIDTIGRGIVVSDAVIHHDDPKVAGRLTERLVDVLDGTRDDQDVDAVFLGPAIAGADDDTGLFDRRRSLLPSGAAYLTDAAGETDD